MSTSTQLIIGRGTLSLLLGSVALAGLMSPAHAWTADNPTTASQCVPTDVNDPGIIVMNCPGR
jgi:hypothetical protein